MICGEVHARFKIWYFDALRDQEVRTDVYRSRFRKWSTVVSNTEVSTAYGWKLDYTTVHT